MLKQNRETLNIKCTRTKEIRLGEIYIHSLADKLVLSSRYIYINLSVYSWFQFEPVNPGYAFWGEVHRRKCMLFLLHFDKFSFTKYFFFWLDEFWIVNLFYVQCDLNDYFSITKSLLDLLNNIINDLFLSDSSCFVR